MPELPEVETIRRTLVPYLLGQVVRAVHLFTPTVWRGQDPAAMVGCHVTGLDRRGKHLLISLSRSPGSAHGDAASRPGASDQPPGGAAARSADGGGGAVRSAGSGGPALGELVLHVHLGMTGRLTFLPPGDPAPDRHVHARFSFDRGELSYQDTRRFGYLELLPGSSLGDHPRLRLGPEPLDGSFTTEVLRGMLAGRRAPVKAVLLDQHIMAGIGNIYADEALHRAGVHPLRPAGDLGEREVETLRDALREVLEEAIAARGTTFSDYRDGEGRPGEFVSRLCVYGREGEACPRCGTPVARQRLGGRSTYFCPRCQK